MSKMCNVCVKKIDVYNDVHYTDVCGCKFYCTYECMKEFIMKEFRFLDDDSDISEFVIKIEPAKIKKIAKKIKDDLNGNGNE